MDSGDGGTSPKARPAPLGIDRGGSGGGGASSAAAAIMTTTPSSPSKQKGDDAARAGAPRASEGDGDGAESGGAAAQRSLLEEVGATLAWPSLIGAIIALAVTIAAQRASPRRALWCRDVCPGPQLQVAHVPAAVAWQSAANCS
jgi:hypothetical protein